MQFSQHWLHTWIHPQLSTQQLSNLLTMAGLEVETIEQAAPLFTGVVIAEVKSVSKHPNADRLNITQVDAGTGELVQIVCGASNVAVGIKVPCALPGAVLPHDFQIKPTKMRGELSNGMLCSAKELGLPESHHVDGLHILPSDAPIGHNIREYLDLDDEIFTLKITPNRADCLSIKGLAREISALTQYPVQSPTIQAASIESEKTQAVRIDAPEDCGRFISRVIEHVNAQAPTPAWLKQRLERSGIRSISALVDIGNYVMLELGQPMHVFDADKLSGSLIVRRAYPNESLTCLNEKTVQLSDNTLVVADEKGALSIAGFMGGSASAVSNQTRNIVLEAAWFNPDIIAGKSRQYGFGSDSAFRFERGVDYTLQMAAIERATELILTICGGIAGSATEAIGRLPESKTVQLRLARIQKLLGIHIDAAQVHTILQHLELNPVAHDDGFEITVPPFRFDINIEADLIEEIARIYGYEHIPAERTSGLLNMLALPETQQSRFHIYQHMAAKGYQEVVSYAFVNEQWEQDFANNPNPIRLQNPLAAQYSLMRSTLIGGLVEILQNNLNRKQSRLRVFEIARVFHQQTDGHYQQNERLGGLVYGNALPEQWGSSNRPVDFYDVKADIESLLFNKDSQFIPTQHPALHPGRAAHIILNEQIIGFIGELHPKWLQKYDLPQAPIVFELDMQALLTQEKTIYQPISKFQAVRRDLAFVLPEQTQFTQLQQALATVKHPYIQAISLFDVYRGTGLPENSKSMAVKIILQSPDNTLTDEQIEPIMAQLIQAASNIGAKLR